MKHADNYEDELEKDESRGNRLGVSVPPERLRDLPASRAMWHEGEEEIAEGLKEGRARERRLCWVRAALALLCTPREQACVRFYYFGGLDMRAAAARAGTSPATACRDLRAAVAKLREAARALPKDHFDGE